MYFGLLGFPTRGDSSEYSKEHLNKPDCLENKPIYANTLVGCVVESDASENLIGDREEESHSFLLLCRDSHLYGAGRKEIFQQKY